MKTSDQTATRKTLADKLYEARLITEQQLQNVIDSEEHNPRNNHELLIKQGLITSEELAIMNSFKLDVPFVTLSKYSIQSQALEKIPEITARRFNVFPLSLVNDCLIVAMEDPGNIQVIDDISALTRLRIEPVIASRNDILESIDHNYKGTGEIENQLKQIEPDSLKKGEEEESELSAESVARAPVVRIMDLVISQAIKDHSSDIHIEPQEDHLRIRYRIDGVLHNRLSLPLTIHPQLLSRIKILGGMNIAERRRPQDGQINFKMGEKEVDLRVATANTSWGEMAVLRILDKSFALLNLEQLGFQGMFIKKYRQMLDAPYGMILISGPTGSGKTTTLYASLGQIDSHGKNIITIEDPIEYSFENINQMQVNHRAGITFATGLRACMRLDPDIMLVGEIRDKETAEIAVQSALTGHLVLSSIHANDAAGVILRLQDLGIEPFLIASSVIGIIAQRMTRRTCRQCATATKPSTQEKLAYESETGEELTEYLHGTGCNTCAETGYKGRTGIFEVMAMSEDIRRMVIEGASTDAIRLQAIKEGMHTMQRDGMSKVKQGITTPFEVLRNTIS